ncbi:MAG: hypothetical protein JNJ55_02725, partial [Betaproteobacteria bacterium]|nr:hypothetical protein [Betaproteobacteria bacterium]
MNPRLIALSVAIAATLPAVSLAQTDARAIGAKDAFASPVLVVAPKPPARAAGDS